MLLDSFVLIQYSDMRVELSLCFLILSSFILFYLSHFFSFSRFSRLCKYLFKRFICRILFKNLYPVLLCYLRTYFNWIYVEHVTAYYNRILLHSHSKYVCIELNVKGCDFVVAYVSFKSTT